MKQSNTIHEQKDKATKTKPNSRPQRWQPRRPEQPVLRFSPTAWAKLQYFCHHGDTEIGGFGVSRSDNVLAIEDFVTVKQRVTAVTVAFDDEAVADFFDAQVDAGRKPEQFSRIWLHTHPGSSPTPSATDEDTFSRVFGGCTWAVMFILACGGQTYCRLRFNVGPGGEMLIPTEVDYSRPFAASDHSAWEAEYDRNVQMDRTIARRMTIAAEETLRAFDDPWDAEFEAMLAHDRVDDLDAVFNEDTFDFDFERRR